MLTDFQIFFTGRFNSKYATQSSLTIPPHLKRVPELPYETSISKNWQKIDACIVINNKSQGSLVTCLRCGGLFSNHFTADFLLSLLVKKIFKSLNIWQSYRQEVTNTTTYHMQCKSILLQYLFFCITADAYCGNFSRATVYLLVSELNNAKMTVRNF